MRTKKHVLKKGWYRSLSGTWHATLFGKPRCGREGIAFVPGSKRKALTPTQARRHACDECKEAVNSKK